MVVCIVLNDGIFLLFMAYLSQDEAKNYTYYFTPEFLQWNLKKIINGKKNIEK